MQNKKSIVILYTKEHYDQPAFGLEEYIYLVYNDCDVITIDENGYKNPLWSTFKRKCHQFSVRNFPRIFNMVHNFYYQFIKNTNAFVTALDVKKDNAKTPRKGLKSRRMRNIIERFNPDIILCMTPKSLKLALKARRELMREEDVQVYAFSTDYSIDKRFLNAVPDVFLVQNEAGVKLLEEKKFPEERIFVAGLPLPLENFREYDRAEIREMFGIRNDLPVITVAGGRLGISYAKKLFDLAMPYRGEYNIVAAAGSKGLEKYYRLVAKHIKNNENIYVVEQIDHFSKVLSITDILITLPTVSICYEAMARSIPCIVGDPTGALELANTKYLLANNFVLNGRDKELFEGSIENLINDTRYHENLVENMRDFASRSDARDTGDFLYQKAALQFDKKKAKEETEA